MACLFLSFLMMADDQITKVRDSNLNFTLLSGSNKTLSATHRIVFSGYFLFWAGARASEPREKKKKKHKQDMQWWLAARSAAATKRATVPLASLQQQHRISSAHRRWLSHTSCVAQESKNEGQATNDTAQHQVRRNAANIQMLPMFLWQHLFKADQHAQAYVRAPPQSTTKKIKEHLSAFGLWGKQTSTLPEIPAFTPPPLAGDTILEHFSTIAQRQVGDTRAAAIKLMNATLPPIPDSFVVQPGWTKYTLKQASADAPASLDRPQDPATPRFKPLCQYEHERVQAPIQPGAKTPQGIVFDVETTQHVNNFPVVATAATADAWFVWLSPVVCSQGTEHLCRPFLCVSVCVCVCLCLCVNMHV